MWYETLHWIALTLVLVLLPVVIFVIKGSPSRWIGLIVLFYTAMAFGAALWMGNWLFWSYYLLLAVALGAVIAAFLAVRKMLAASWQRPGRLGLVLSAVLLLGGLYFAQSNVRAFAAAQTPSDTIDMVFPMEPGTYAYAQAGAARPLQNGHAGVSSQQYAMDIVRLNDGLHTYESYLNFGDHMGAETMDAQVVAPCAGEVVWVRDGMPDNKEPAEDRPAGNVIALDCDGVTVYMAHMRQNSIEIAEGDTVSAGQPLARIGISGRSTDAHLHIHGERGPLKKDFSDNPGVPISFNGTFGWRGRVVTID